MLNNSITIDEQLRLDKAKKNELLLDVVNKYSESKKPLTTVTATQCLTLKDMLSKKISEKNQFCLLYSSKHHEMSQDKKTGQNVQYLNELRELHSDRALLHLTKKIGQYGIHDFNDVHQRALMLTAPEKKYLLKTVFPKNIFIFLNLSTVVRRVKISLISEFFL